MSYYNVCPYCDANLDPGEKCDCQNSKKVEKAKADARTAARELLYSTACINKLYMAESEAEIGRIMKTERFKIGFGGEND